MIIITNCEKMKNDIYDVLHMFYPESALDEKDGIVFTHNLEIIGDNYVNEVDLNGQAIVETERIYEFSNELEKKRVLKRAIKLACYKLLSKINKTDLPWGSLTGIRPTKLAYDLIADGLDPLFVGETLTKNFLVSPEKAKLVQSVISNQNCIIKNDNLIDLYINIPVCPSRCIYCSFISSELDKVRLLIPAYIDSLIKEIRAVKELIAQKALVVRTIYVGGGTPSVLDPEDIDRLLAELSYPVGEFTYECGRADTITREKLEVLKKHGVTRICINPQTFSQKTLKTIGRKHTIEDVLKAYKLALEFGFDTNMDLIAGLPGENLSTFKKSIDTAIELSPDNITVHTLSIKNGAELKDKPLPVDEKVEEMVSYSYNALTQDEYVPYYLYRQKNQLKGLENVGYTKRGKLCLFNVDSMEEACSIIACGAGAISKRVFNLESRIERQANPKFISDYISRVDEMIEKKRSLWQ